MSKIIVDIERCKGCGMCVHVCPKKILVLDSKIMNTKGYHPSVCIDMDKCTGCAFCAVMCPDICIEVEK